MDFSAGATAEKLKSVPSAEGTILSFELGSGPQAPWPVLRSRSHLSLVGAGSDLCL